MPGSGGTAKGSSGGASAEGDTMGAGAGTGVGDWGMNVLGGGLSMACAGDCAGESAMGEFGAVKNWRQGDGGVPISVSSRIPRAKATGGGRAMKDGGATRGGADAGGSGGDAMGGAGAGAGSG